MNAETTSASDNEKEVDNIRSILFGDQIQEFDSRFNLVDQSIATIRSEIRNLRAALESETSLRERTHNNLQKELQTAISSETNQREDAINDLQNKLQETIKNIIDQQKTRDDDWNEMIVLQTSLHDALQKFLDEYKKRINSLAHSGD